MGGWAAVGGLLAAPARQEGDTSFTLSTNTNTRDWLAEFPAAILSQPVCARINVAMPCFLLSVCVCVCVCVCVSRKVRKVRIKESDKYWQER